MSCIARILKISNAKTTKVNKHQKSLGLQGLKAKMHTEIQKQKLEPAHVY